MENTSKIIIILCQLFIGFIAIFIASISTEINLSVRLTEAGVGIINIIFGFIILAEMRFSYFVKIFRTVRLIILLLSSVIFVILFFQYINR